MKIGDKYSRKDYEYTVVGMVRHRNTGGFVYVIEQRKFGEEEVSYFLQEHEFRNGFKYEGFTLE